MLSQDFITAHLKKKTIVSRLLYPLSFFIQIYTILRRSFYDFFPSMSYKSKFKIISVGNITAGGSGKTPFTLFLAKELIEKGHKIAIVLRGYKGNLENTNKLFSPPHIKLFQNNIPEESNLDWKKAGDEASLYASNLPNTPICVGKNRIKSIKLLEENFPDIDFIIMDDAFQHLKVVQDVKIVIFLAQNPVGNGFCLPAGMLREPISSLKYADYFVINGDFSTLNSPNLKKEMDRVFFQKLEKYNKQILFGGSTISDIKDFEGIRQDIKSLKNKKILLLSGIGSPQSFENTILNAGITFQNHLSLTDHFNYSSDFFDLHKNYLSNYDIILTTEKDYNKLRYINCCLPIYVVYIRFSLCDQSVKFIQLQF
ncbi:MAG: tetraacyldisaccharide 4'-kinase [Candidatus Cloacimonetes bacterium]|nr:tetraacyldisaccharide 4'-kinase [Candidatus Cloacimonadota bacterium]